MQPIDLVSLIVEVVAWIGIVAGAGCLIAAVFARAADGSWSAVQAVVVDAGPARIARWFAGGGFQERELEHDEVDRVAGADEYGVWVRDGDPARMRFDPVPHGRRVLSSLSWALLGTGVAALAVSIVLMFVE